MFDDDDLVEIIPGDKLWIEHVCTISIMPTKHVTRMIDKKETLRVVHSLPRSGTGRIVVEGKYEGLPIRWYIHPSCLRHVNPRCVFDV